MGNLQTNGVVKAHGLNALDIKATAALIRATNARIVIQAGTSFLNMAVLAACIETGAAYIDTAIHEDPAKTCEAPPWYANYEWKQAQACADAGVTAILGAGFDPGVVNAYAKLAVDELFDEVSSIDIIDTNAGSHGKYFATNFDPRSTSASSPDPSGHGRKAAGARTACSKSSAPGTCPWSAARPPT